MKLKRNQGPHAQDRCERDHWRVEQRLAAAGLHDIVLVMSRSMLSLELCGATSLPGAKDAIPDAADRAKGV